MVDSPDKPNSCWKLGRRTMYTYQASPTIFQNVITNRKTPIVKEVVLTTLKAKYMCVYTQ